MTDSSLPLSIKFATAGLGGIGGWGYVFLLLYPQSISQSRSDRFNSIIKSIENMNCFT